MRNVVRAQQQRRGEFGIALPLQGVRPGIGDGIFGGFGVSVFRGRGRGRRHCARGAALRGCHAVLVRAPLMPFDEKFDLVAREGVKLAVIRYQAVPRMLH
jgi:hypothetical protein